MSTPDLTFIPKRVRRLLLLVLAISALGSAALCVYFAVFVPRMEIAVVSLGAAQAAVSGFVLVALVSFSLRMRTADDLQLLQDEFFRKDLLPALRLCGAARAEPAEFAPRGWFASAPPSLKPSAKLTTNINRGADSVSVLLEDASGFKLDIYLKVNVKHLIVRYFFDPEDYPASEGEAGFLSAFEQTLNGARSVGFDVKVVRRFHASKGRNVLELTLYLDVGEGMLVDPERRLFLRNDIRTLTESIMHTRKGHLIQAGRDQESFDMSR